MDYILKVHVERAFKIRFHENKLIFVGGQIILHALYIEMDFTAVLRIVWW